MTSCLQPDPMGARALEGAKFPWAWYNFLRHHRRKELVYPTCQTAARQQNESQKPQDGWKSSAPVSLLWESTCLKTLKEFRVAWEKVGPCFSFVSEGKDTGIDARNLLLSLPLTLSLSPWVCNRAKTWLTCTDMDNLLFLCWSYDSVNSYIS